MCLFSCGKHCPILFLLNLSAYFSSLKNIRQKRNFDILCFLSFGKETEKVLCFTKSAVWEIYVQLRKIKTMVLQTFTACCQWQHILSWCSWLIISAMLMLYSIFCWFNKSLPLKRLPANNSLLAPENAKTYNCLDLRKEL